MKASTASLPGRFMPGWELAPAPRFRGGSAGRKLISLLCVIASLATGAGAATLEAVLADPQLWPADVVLTASTKASLIRDGQVAGQLLLGRGTKIKVTGVTGEGVTGKLAGQTVRVPLAKTDLMQSLTVEEASEGRAPAAAPPPPPAPAESPTAVQRLLLGRLVHLEDGALKPYDQRKLNGVKFYGIMFSAGWCGPCRAFAPRLLENYRSLKSVYPEFELVLVSADHSAADMLAYMREEKMPWPAIKYSELGAVDEIRKLAGPGIPCLVLIDGDGKVLADSFRGNDYLGPDSVLEATWRELKKHRSG